MNTSIGMYIYNGMGAAACVLGFLFVIVAAAAAFFLIAYGILLIAQAGEKGHREEVRRRGRAQDSGYQSSGQFEAVGRHVRKGL